MAPVAPVVQRLILARHGRTAWNLQGRFQGQADPPLDEIGRAQADQLAVEMASWHPDMVVSSDLLRARQTAAPVARCCGLEPSTDVALREVNMGAWEGLQRDEVERRFPDEYRRWVAGTDPVRPGGESEAQAGRRAVAGLRRIMARAPGGATVAVVAHGPVLRQVIGLLAEEGSIALDGEAPHLANGQWRIFPFAVAPA